MSPKQIEISTGSVYNEEREISVCLKRATKCPVTALGLGLHNQLFPASLVMGTGHGVWGWSVHRICSVEWLLSIISHVSRDGSQNLPENLYVPRNIRELTVIWMICQPLLFLHLMLLWSLWNLDIFMNFLYCFSEIPASHPPGTLSILTWMASCFL